METKTGKSRTKNYFATANNDAEGLAAIKELRKTIKIQNLIDRTMALQDPNFVPITRRVSLYGRLGKNNPNSDVYRYKFGNGYQRIDIKHAATIDIYVTQFKKHVCAHWQTGAPMTFFSSIY